MSQQRNQGFVKTSTWDEQVRELTRKCITQRTLFLQAYTSLSLCLFDQQTGVISLRELHRRHGVLQVWVAEQSDRLKRATGLDSPREMETDERGH